MISDVALAEIGLGATSAEAKAALFARASGALPRGAQRSNARALYVPGRIEVLGKHTDYAGGQSLLAAVDRGFCVAYQPRADDVVCVRDVVRGEECAVRLGAAVGRLPSWPTYVAAVARRIGRDFPHARRGADIVLASDLPSAAGMSSSSALVVAVALAVLEVNELQSTAAFTALFPSRGELAGYLGAVENGRAFGPFAGDAGVGTFGGSEDHVAALCCRAQTVSRYSFAPVCHLGDHAIPDGYTFAVAASGITANKTGAALAPYNHISSAATRLLSIANSVSGTDAPTLAAALGSDAAVAPAIRDALACAAPDAEFSPEYLRGRFDQFVEETLTLVPGAADALARGALAEFGSFVDRSQSLAERCLGNQIGETIALHRHARSLGAVAASAFGAGFGGSVWTMIPHEGADDFVAQWSNLYLASHPAAARRARFFVTPAGPGAHIW